MNAEVDTSTVRNGGYHPHIFYPFLLQMLEKEDSSYDLILTDEHMPNMNGIEFTRKAMECYEKQQVSPPVIVMCTADYSPALGHRSLEAGAQGK